MSYIDYYKINPQDTTKVNKGIPSLKQIDYYDFNSSSEIEEPPLEIQKPEQGNVAKGNKSPGKPNKTSKEKGVGNQKKTDKADATVNKKFSKEAGSKKEAQSKKDLKPANAAKEKEVSKDSVVVLMPKNDVINSGINPALIKKFPFLRDTIQSPFDFNYFSEFLGKYRTDYVKSIFSGHELNAISGGVIARNNSPQGWILLFIVFVLASFAWIKTYRYKKIKQLFSAFFATRITGQMMREERPFSDKTSLQMFLCSLITISIFSFQSLSLFNVSLFSSGNSYIYLKILGLIALIILLKVISFRVLGYVFMLSKLADEYIFTLLLFTNIIGIFIIPVIIGIEYTSLINPEIYAVSGLFLTGFIYLYGLYRVILMGVNNTAVSNFYLFIYLCTLEILPVLVIYKSVVGLL